MTAVLLFAKAPRPGYVKTRLARDIGDGAAATIYRKVGGGVAAAIGCAYPLSVWYEPTDALEEMRAWLKASEYLPQVGGDLGARMRRALAEHFARGDRPVVIVGADAPGVDASVITRAVSALRAADVVLGPALDGGYYLIGLNAMLGELFDDIPWGGASVLDATLARCRTVGARVALLDPLRDVDTVTDVQALGLDCP